jgi:hypothetical protein
MSEERENLIWAPYLKGIPSLTARQARLAAADSSSTPEDRREISRSIARIKRLIRAARERALGPS